MTEIKLVGLDAAVSNVGVAKARLILPERRIVVDDIILVQTEKDGSKKVRSNSDDLRRLSEIAQVLKPALLDSAFFMAEIPSGAQSARAAFLLGAAVGLIACSREYLDRPLIQVQPRETKMAAVGRDKATKPEIIRWAHHHYPALPWIRVEQDSKNFKKGDLHKDNEHCADAIAVLHAGIETDQFRQALALMGGLVRAA